MLNSVQLPSKLLVFFLFIIFISYSEGVEFGASPTKITKGILINEEYCYNIDLFCSDKIGHIKVRDYRTVNEGNVKINYKDDFLIESNDNFEFCIIAEKTGKYKGYLEFDLIDTGAKINILLEIEVFDENNLGKITGRSVINTKGILYNEVYVLAFLTLILVIVFIYMIFKLFR